MSEEAPKLRLRPKLAADSPATPSSPAPIPMPGRPAPEAAPAEAATLRLKPRIAAEPTSSVPASGSSPAPAFAIVVTDPIAPAPLASTPSPAHAVPQVAAASESPTASPPAPSLVDRTKQVQRAALIVAGTGVVIFAVIATIAFPRLVAEQARHDSAAARLEEFVRSSQDAERPEAGADAKPSGSLPATALKPAAAATSAPAHTAQVPSPETPAAAAPAGPGVGDAETAVRVWVHNLKITGLRTGATPRLLLGGTSFKAGDVVNAEFGLRFDGYDADRRMLRFRDAAGTVIERRHP